MSRSNRFVQQTPRPEPFREPVPETPSLREASKLPGLKETILRGEQLGDQEVRLSQCENAATGLFNAGLQMFIDTFGADAVVSALEASNASDTLVDVLRKLEPDPEKRRNFFADMPMCAHEQLASRPARVNRRPEDDAWPQGRVRPPSADADARPAADRLVTKEYASRLGMVANACLRIEGRERSGSFDRAIAGTDFLPYFQSIARSNPELAERLRSFDGDLLEIIDDLRADIDGLRHERKALMGAATEYVTERLRELIDTRDAKIRPIDARQRRIERELEASPELRDRYSGILADNAQTRERIMAANKPADQQIERWNQLLRYIQRIERS